MFQALDVRERFSCPHSIGAITRLSNGSLYFFDDNYVWHLKHQIMESPKFIDEKWLNANKLRGSLDAIIYDYREEISLIIQV